MCYYLPHDTSLHKCDINPDGVGLRDIISIIDPVKNTLFSFTQHMLDSNFYKTNLKLCNLKVDFLATSYDFFAFVLLDVSRKKIQ